MGVAAKTSSKPSDRKTILFSEFDETMLEDLKRAANPSPPLLKPT